MSAFPVFGDLGQDAWATDDNNPFFDPNIDTGYLQYRYYLSPAEVSAATNRGWTMSALMRIVDVPDDTDFAVSLAVTDGSVEFPLTFGAQADGDPVVALHGLAPIALEGLGGGYHFYQLRFDPFSASVSLLVDGVQRLSGHVGNLEANVPMAVWGSSGGPGTGQGNFASVSFEVSDVPEPGTGIAVGLLLALGATARWIRNHDGWSIR